MVGVIKIEKVNNLATNGDVGALFREYGLYPEEVHWLKNERGLPFKSAFVAFRANLDVHKARQADGAVLLGTRLSVITSSPFEFNNYFPGKPLIPKNTGKTQRMFGNDYYADYSYRNVDDHQLHDNYTNRRQLYYTSNAYQRNFSGEELKGDQGKEVQSYRLERSDYQSRYDFDERVMKNQHSDNDRKKQETREKDRSNNRNGRSRSPVDRASKKVSKDNREKPRKDSGDKAFQQASKKSDVKERNFMRITGFSSQINPDKIREFFRALKVVNIYLLKFSSGSNAGKLNGSAIVEFGSEDIARKALTYDGMKSGSQNISVFRAAKEDIIATLKSTAPQVLTTDLDTLNDLASKNSEVHRLVGLLNAAVNNIADSSPPSSTSSKQRKQHDHKVSASEKRKGKDKNLEDPVIDRVATSANIKVEDIKNGRVVGMRNLPYTVTPHMILDLFQGYRAVRDSVRIHYLDNGQCSGDAIITFRDSSDARKAVRELNKKIVHNRKVELFFL